MKITATGIRKTALLLAGLVIATNVGYQLGQRQVTVAVNEQKQVVVNSSPPPDREVDFSLFWEVWSKLEAQYIDKSKLDPRTMVYGAISGMVNSLDDPYTLFLPPQENEDYKEDLNGAFEGIGAQLGAKEERIVVIAPLKNHPAEAAGIKAGDWIVKVDGKETFGWTVPQAVTKIRGPRGTPVTLTVVREGREQPIDITIVRDTIVIKSVEYETRNIDPACVSDCEQAAIITLSRFGDRTNDEWNEIVANLLQSRASERILGLVLDMRNNPGGYLQSAIYIASEFIDSGVVVVQENSDGTRETQSVNRVGALRDMPLVVLINEGSASAAEIVAGALRDHDRAVLVGKNTFGKGSIQTPEDLEDGSGLHITTARWILPDGDWINDTGIAPDIEIDMDDTATDSADLQLERAILELAN